MESKTKQCLAAQTQTAETQKDQIATLKQRYLQATANKRRSTWGLPVYPGCFSRIRNNKLVVRLVRTEYQNFCLRRSLFAVLRYAGTTNTG